MESLTKKELLQIIAELRAEIDLLKKANVEIQLLKQENAELKRRLNLTSENSNQPSSTDGFKKKARTTSTRGTLNKKSGGQIGQAGKTLKQTDNPDVLKLDDPQECPTCQADISNVVIEKIIKRQVIDMPIPAPIITEYQVTTKTCCACKTIVEGAFPEAVKAPVQYGNNILSAAVYLQNQHLIPEERTSETLNVLYKLFISSTTVAKASIILFEKLENFEKQILEYIKKVSLKHADETGFQVNGIRQWLHVLSTYLVTYYATQKQRSFLVEGMTGTLVHDHWPVYLKYDKSLVQHAYCNAHHLRELKALIEIDKEAWASDMFKLLFLANELKKKYDGSPPAIIQNLLKLAYDKIIKEGFAFHAILPPLIKKAKQGKQPHRKGYNLLYRLETYSDDVLRFLYEPDVPFTNNLAEQDLRMMKLKLKISGCFRTDDGAKIFARIRSFISTVRKMGLDPFQSIIDAFNGITPLLPTV